MIFHRQREEEVRRCLNSVSSQSRISRVIVIVIVTTAIIIEATVTMDQCDEIHVFNAYDVARVKSTDCSCGKIDIPGFKSQASRRKARTR